MLYNKVYYNNNNNNNMAFYMQHYFLAETRNLLKLTAWPV